MLQISKLNKYWHIVNIWQFMSTQIIETKTNWNVQTKVSASNNVANFKLSYYNKKWIKYNT